MSDTQIEDLPEICPNHNAYATWAYMPLGFWYCTHAYGTPERCMWPINDYAPESPSYATAQEWVEKWKMAWGYA